MVSVYEQRMAAGAGVFVNGPPGGRPAAGSHDQGTRRLWQAVAAAPGTTLIGGGDTVASARKFVDTARIDLTSARGVER